MTDMTDTLLRQYPVLTLTPADSNEKIRRTAFDFVHDVGYMVFASTALDGKTPTARGLEVHYLDGDHNLYLGIAKGKPCYLEWRKYPYLTGVIIRDTVRRLSVSVRISAHLTEIDPARQPEIYKKYWQLNPGTQALYRKDLSMFRIFLLDRGEGEVFHLPADDEVRRVRFSFGQQAVRPWAYEIDSGRCVGCGMCAQACMEDVIAPDEKGLYRINHFGCLECGRCYMNCPNGAIRQRCGQE